MKAKSGNDGARRRMQRRRRVRRKVEASDRTSLSIYRSSKHIYAQVINDVTGATLAAASTFGVSD